jgi:hypothetical protein
VTGQIFVSFNEQQGPVEMKFQNRSRHLSAQHRLYAFANGFLESEQVLNHAAARNFARVHEELGGIDDQDVEVDACEVMLAPLNANLGDSLSALRGGQRQGFRERPALRFDDGELDGIVNLK